MITIAMPEDRRATRRELPPILNRNKRRKSEMEEIIADDPTKGPWAEARKKKAAAITSRPMRINYDKRSY